MIEQSVNVQLGLFCPIMIYKLINGFSQKQFDYPMLGLYFLGAVICGLDIYKNGLLRYTIRYYPDFQQP